MTKVSTRLNRLSESATLAMARMSRELKMQGHDVIALSLGEPDFDTPDFVKEAAKNTVAQAKDVVDAAKGKKRRGRKSNNRRKTNNNSKK